MTYWARRVPGCDRHACGLARAGQPCGPLDVAAVQALAEAAGEILDGKGSHPLGALWTAGAVEVLSRLLLAAWTALGAEVAAHRSVRAAWQDAAADAIRLRAEIAALKRGRPS